MPTRKLNLKAIDDAVERGLTQIRVEREIPESFPDEVTAEARSVEPTLSENDLTDIPFVTIDPPGSRDLDQALYLEQRAQGYRVRYAIADVANFVSPGGPMDEEARERGMTMYGPDRRTLLYPAIISEGSASLLPDETRPALVWTLDLDESGELVDKHVGRAVVRSRVQLDYQAVQHQLDSGTTDESLSLLSEVGRLRQLIGKERDAITLPIPDQEVVKEDGHWQLEYRSQLPVEGWNAEISILTGIAAASLMVDAGVGILRTLPPARTKELDWLRRVAKGLGVNWPKGVTYPNLIASLDARIPAQAALLAESTSLFSGAGYQALEPGVEPHEHAALATRYAHATAPLRRLVDRFVGEACMAICAGQDVPDWVDEALPSLPKAMARADSIAGSYEAACVNLVEAALLSHRIGDEFSGVVIDVDRDDPHGEVQVRNPAVRARIEGQNLDLGEKLQVRLVVASVPDRTVVFERA